MFKWLIKKSETIEVNDQSKGLIIPTVQNCIHQIQTLTGVTQADFKALYVQTIKRYLEFISIPNQPADGVRVQEVLDQVVLALKRRRGYLLPLNADSETSFREREEWTFAVFVVALLTDIDLGVKWDVAKALIPTNGFAWLHRNQRLFILWQGYLQGDESNNIFEQIINPSGIVDAVKVDQSAQSVTDIKLEKVIQPLKKALPVVELNNQINRLADSDVSSETKKSPTLPDDAVIQEIDLAALMADEHKISKDNKEKDEDHNKKSSLLPAYNASDFWDWLKESISSQDISINNENSVIHGVDKGLFIRLPEAIDHFLKAQADQLGLPYDKTTLPQRIQLTKGIKKHDKLLRTEQGSRIHVYCLGDWQNRNVISGVIIPTDALLSDHPSPPINQALMLDPIDNT